MWHNFSIDSMWSSLTYYSSYFEKSIFKLESNLEYVSDVVDPNPHINCLHNKNTLRYQLWIHIHLPYISNKISVCHEAFVRCVVCLGELNLLLSLSSLLLFVDDVGSLFKHLPTLKDLKKNLH